MLQVTGHPHIGDGDEPEVGVLDDLPEVGGDDLADAGGDLAGAGLVDHGALLSGRGEPTLTTRSERDGAVPPGGGTAPFRTEVLSQRWR